MCTPIFNTFVTSLQFSLIFRIYVGKDCICIGNIVLNSKKWFIYKFMVPFTGGVNNIVKCSGRTRFNCDVATAARRQIVNKRRCRCLWYQEPDVHWYYQPNCLFYFQNCCIAARTDVKLIIMPVGNVTLPNLVSS